MISQSATIKKLKPLFLKHYPEARFIKIHGSKYQEKGLMDLMVLTWTENYWLEIKNDWVNDKPSEIQKWNVRDLSGRNFITGFVVGDEYKGAWESSTKIPIKTLIKKSLSKMKKK